MNEGCVIQLIEPSWSMEKRSQILPVGLMSSKISRSHTVPYTAASSFSVIQFFRLNFFKPNKATGFSQYPPGVANKCPLHLLDYLNLQDLID